MENKNLIKCSDCGKEISIKAGKCPQCGAPNKIKKKLEEKKAGIGCLSIIAIVVVFIMIVTTGDNITKDTTLGDYKDKSKSDKEKFISDKIDDGFPVDDFYVCMEKNAAIKSGDLKVGEVLG